MIKAVDERLELWASEVRTSSTGGAMNIVAVLMENGGEIIRSTAGSVPLSILAIDTGKAVAKLPELYSAVVFAWYIQATVHTLPAQIARKVGVSLPTLYRRLHKAHELIAAALGIRVAA